MGGAFARLSGKQLWGLPWCHLGNIDSSYLWFIFLLALSKASPSQDAPAPMTPVPNNTPSQQQAGQGPPGEVLRAHIPQAPGPPGPRPPCPTSQQSEGCRRCFPEGGSQGGPLPRVCSSLPALPLRRPCPDWGPEPPKAVGSGEAQRLPHLCADSAPWLVSEGGPLGNIRPPAPPAP